MKEFRNHMKKFWPEKLKHNQEVAICPLWTSSTIAFHIWYVSSFQVRIFSEKQTAVEFLKNSKKISNKSGFHIFKNFNKNYKNFNKNYKNFDKNCKNCERISSEFKKKTRTIVYQLLFMIFVRLDIVSK